MGIFTGNEMLFILTGVIMTLFIWLLSALNKKYSFRWHTWLLGLCGGFMFVFALLWAVSSILEGEPQAANMGLVIFGVPALLLFGIGFKLAHSGRNVNPTD